MQSVNAEMNPAQMQQTMKAFAMEMEKAGIQSEMMGDAFEMMEDPSASADAEDVYNGILGEIGLEYTSGAAAVPTNAIVNPNAAAAQQEENKQEDDNLEARLAALRMWETTQGADTTKTTYSDKTVIRKIRGAIEPNYMINVRQNTQMRVSLWWYAFYDCLFLLYLVQMHVYFSIALYNY